MDGTDELDKLPPSVCEDCDGIGQMTNLTGEQIITCRSCGGTGKVKDAN